MYAEITIKDQDNKVLVTHVICPLYAGATKLNLPPGCCLDLGCGLLLAGWEFIPITIHPFDDVDTAVIAPTTNG